MLREKALRKIFITTVSIFIIMTIYMIPLTEKSIATNLEFEYVTNLANSSIYLLDDNNLLVKVKILLDNKDMKDNVMYIIDNLTVNENNKFSSSLSGIIPSKTKVNKIEIIDDTINIDFNNKILDIDKDISIKMIESLVFSLTEIKNINKVNISVNNEILKYYPNTNIKLNMPLTRNIGINKEYSYTSLDDITKVVIFYNEVIDEEIYYVPVTKYLNDDKDKIEIIVEELTTSYIHEDNLSSLLDENVKLIDKEITDDLLVLDFNKALFDSNCKIKEEVLYTLSYSIFSNYDINAISYKVEGNNVETVKKSDLN